MTKVEDKIIIGKTKFGEFVDVILVNAAIGMVGYWTYVQEKTSTQIIAIIFLTIAMTFSIWR